MHRIPKDLDLSKLNGEYTTQIRVGQYDIQFSIGEVHFAVQSEIMLTNNGKQVGFWKEGIWPDPEFYNIMNTVVESHEIPTDQEIVITFQNGYSMHIYDNSDQTESMSIQIGKEGLWII